MSFPPFFQFGTNDRSDTSLSSSFNLDETGVWGRALTDAEIEALFYNGAGNFYPFFGGPFNLVFQGELINNVEKPFVVGSTNALWNVTRLYDGTTSPYPTFQAILSNLFIGNTATTGMSWVADNFDDKILFAQHDNQPQYWTPPANVAYVIPGLPTSDSLWDGVTVFADHAILWKDDRIKWSDLNDFTTWIPVAATATSAVLTLNSDYVQPPAGGQVTVSVINPVAPVASISVTGDMSFPATNVGVTSDAQLLIIDNTGTTDLHVTGISFGNTAFATTAATAFTVPTGGSHSIPVTFTPTDAVSYSGVITVNSDSSLGTSSITATGDGIGASRIVELGGILDFGSTLRHALDPSFTLQSALTITNNGNSSLTVTAIAVTGAPAGVFNLHLPSLPLTVAAGATSIILVDFIPAAAISYNGIITVTCNSTSGTNTITCSGTGVNSLSPRTVFLTDKGSCQFGKVPDGTSVSGTLYIYNPSSTSFKVTGTSLPNGFTGTASPTLGTRSSTTIPIHFSPVDPAKTYGGFLTVLFAQTVAGQNAIEISGEGTQTGKILVLDGNLDFGEVPENTSAQALLTIKNIGTVTLTVSSITGYPSSDFVGAFSGPIDPGNSVQVLVTFTPTSTSPQSGTITVNNDGTGTNTFEISGTGFTLPGPTQLTTGQYVTIADTQNGVPYYNFYQVVSMHNTSLVLKLVDLTGATPSGRTITADGKQFFTLDANEAGEQRIVGAKRNGPIFRVVPQGDYAYSFKERSIQSIQYTATTGTFFIHNEVSGEGLISREAICDRNDGTMVFLGHKELYSYQGGPNPTIVCQQATRELYRDLDRARLNNIRLFHNEQRAEVWVKYPIKGNKFRVLIWNYVEDSATIDDYDPSVEFTALGVVDWSSDLVWKQMSPSTTWDTMDPDITWEDMTGDSVDHIPVIACKDGTLKIHGLIFSRDGVAYQALSETMTFDLGEPDVFKYVDTVVIGLDIQVVEDATREMLIQIGSQDSLGSTLAGGNDPANNNLIKWSAGETILVNGHAVVPIHVNPGGAGRYLTLRLSSNAPDVQWRVSSFEIFARPGGLY